MRAEDQVWPTVKLIAAVGLNGQIGLNEMLPWARDREDMQFFYNHTRGSSLIMGARTARKLQWGHKQMISGGRIVYHYHGETPDTFIDMINDDWPQKEDVWICGGAYTYKRFLPYVRRSYITQMRYDGPADSYMPPLWSVK